MRRVGFLHTGAVHVRTFTELLRQLDPVAQDRHLVEEHLLDDARARGADDPVVAERLLAQLRDLASDSDAILCTCSTLGGVAEALTETVGVPVLRVDRPMAQEAIRLGGTIGIVAAVESTINPTRALVLEEAAAAGRSVNLLDLSCLKAWPLFEAGDLDAYLRRIADHVDEVAPQVDVLLLAQASMAAAVSLCSTYKPVLASPALGVRALVAATQPPR